MSDYRTLENKIRDIVAKPWTKDPKKVHHKLQQIQKKIIDEEPEMLNNKALGISDAVVEAAKQINKGKTEVDVNPQYKTDVKDSEDDNDDDKKVKIAQTIGATAGGSALGGLAGSKIGDAAYKAAKPYVKPAKEELKGKQHKLDKNKNGKVDAHDFKLLRKEEVEQIDEKEVVFTGSPQHTAKKAAEHEKMGYKVVSMKKHTSGSFGDNSEKHTYKMAKEEAELDEADSYSIRNTETDTDRIYHISKYPITTNHSIYKKIKAKDPKAQIHKNGQPMKEEVCISDEEQARLDAIAASFTEDTVQSDEPEGDMVEEGNLAAQIRDAKPSITGHIEVSVGDKKVKIPHKKAQDFLGSYHSKRTPNEKDDHEKAFRKEIGG
jgi:hypothetical protein